VSGGRAECATPGSDDLTRSSVAPAYGRQVPNEFVIETVGRLARRKPIRPEAETQADIYMLLTTAGLGLEPDDVVKMESQVADGTRRRIDI